jgi:hypothetical protein
MLQLLFSSVSCFVSCIGRFLKLQLVVFLDKALIGFPLKEVPASKLCKFYFPPFELDLES